LLVNDVETWYAAFDAQLKALAPELLMEFRCPGIPVASVEFDGATEVGRVESPVTLDVLEKVVKDELGRLRELNARLFGSLWWFRLRRRLRSLRGKGPE
jgi:hypothetical protein